MNKNPKILTKEFLIKEYIINKKGTAEIAKEIGCTASFIYNQLKFKNIKTRTNSEAQLLQFKLKDILTKDFLYQEYIVNKIPATKIAKEVGCSAKGIYNHLRINNIEIRTKQQNAKGKYNGRYLIGQACNNKCIDCGKKINYGSKRCHICASKLLWKNKEYRAKVVKAVFKALNFSPNKPEKLLIKLLNKILPKEYKFVGDGKLFVSGFCPDFVNKDNNKIIELFGCYWHKCKECGYGKNNLQPKDIGRLKEYTEAGYKTLIIWECELKDLDKVTQRIIEFKP